jgi:CheY-like chemotaxis protein
METATILIADDDPVWTTTIARLLEAEGYRVLRARTGVDALYQARMRRPHLLLLDPELPQLNGWAICRRLRRSPDFANVKIVLLTLDGAAAHRAGADGYLPKSGREAARLPPVRVFRYPAPGILAAFAQRRAAAA